MITMENQTNRFKAYLLQILSSMCLVINQLTIRYSTKYFPTSLLLGIGSSLLFLLNYMYILHCEKQMNIKSINTFKVLIQRSIAGALTIIQLFVASSNIPISVANSIFNINPILLFIIEGFYFHKIKFNKTHAFLTFVCFLGVVFILQPEVVFGESIVLPEQYPFYFLAFGSAITTSFSVTFLHNLKGKADGDVVLQYNYTMQSGFGYILYSITSGGGPVKIDSFVEFILFITLILLIVLVGYLAQLTRLKAVFLVKPSDVVPFSYAGIIVSLLIDIFIYHSQFNAFSIIGIFITSVGLLAKFFVKN